MMRRPLRQAPSPSSTRSAAPKPAARKPRRLSVEEALAPFEEALRAQLPQPEEIIARAAQRRRVVRAGSAACLLGLAAGILVWLDPAYHTETVATATGERGHWTLPDGSELRLNTGSRVTVALHLRSRHLRLDQGEATFQVAHAPWHTAAAWAERSFTVQAGAIAVEDIGTVFNVRLQGDGDDATVTVLEGRVRVHGAQPALAPVELGSGQHLRASAAGPLGTPEAADPAGAAAATAWHEGRAAFDATPLAEAIAELQRHGPLPVTLRGEAVRGLRISGQIDLDRREQFIDLLPALAPVHLVRGADGGVVVEAAGR